MRKLNLAEVRDFSLNVRSFKSLGYDGIYLVLTTAVGLACLTGLKLGIGTNTENILLMGLFVFVILGNLRRILFNLEGGFRYIGVLIMLGTLYGVLWVLGTIIFLLAVVYKVYMELEE